MEISLSGLCIGSATPLPRVCLPRTMGTQDAGASQQAPTFFVGSSPECDLVVAQPGWEPQHLGFSWSRRFSTWIVENLSASPLYIEGQCLQTKQTLPLALWEATLNTEGVLLKFERKPEAPRYAGKPCSQIPIPKQGLMIGRGEKNKDGSDTPRLALDPDLLSISTQQAEIRRSGGDYILVNRNPSGNGRTIVNGDQNFDERKLVLGDCIQIPNCDYYTFKFMGENLRHLGQGGALQGLGLTVDVSHGRILHPVYLELRRGGFLGIIGGSGQGKSTLMNALCGIVPATSGSVMVDGMELRSPRDVARAGIGYVPQDDIVHKELTVEDALYFAACLRLKATPSQIRDLLDATMDTLRLTEHRKKIIANLSGGQRKRVSIASELLVSPDYIFLDEPTSGLDPQTERSLMGELSLLAHRKRIGVASTTHVLQNCHVMTRIGFISRGRLIFHGKPVDAVRFFLYSGTPDGAAQNRTATGSRASDSASGSSMGEEEHEFSEADLLGKIVHIYDIAQDTTKPVSDQNQVAEGWQREYQASPYYEAPVRVDESAAKKPFVRTKVSIFRSLSVLLSRQWTILISSKLNYLFLTAQAVVIGVLIAWVNENIVLQMFLALIATLWFGCSNGAQQIVGELAIFRRERLAGLGIHTYLLSKFAFLTAITGIQAMLLFSMLLLGSPLFHRNTDVDLEVVTPDFTGRIPDKDTREFRKAFFDQPWNKLAKGEDDHGEADATPTSATAAAPKSKDDIGIVGLDVDENGKPLASAEAIPKVVYINPTGLHVKDFQYRLLENLSSFFRVRENVLGRLKVHKPAPGESVTIAQFENGSISWRLFMANVLGLRVASLLAAAVVGVALGLAVSSLVDTPTQSVMWVPLILIPQILFGSFVVIRAEMNNSVLGFSCLLPSYNLQRTMDVALVYGRTAPRMTNQTKIPAFLENPPNEKEAVKWAGPSGSQQTEYDKVCEVNKSWQNLVIIRNLLGAREKVLNPAGGFALDSVKSRPDVTVANGDRYLDFGPARESGMVLGGWVLGCYLISSFSLYRRQTGR